MNSESVLPSGTVTFLFSDVVASTRRWVDDPVGMRAALETHDGVMRSVITAHGGYVFSTAGDSFAAAFGSVPAALGCAAAAQQGLSSAAWAGDPIQVRLGVHVGEADERDGDYFGAEVSRTARVMGAAHGGQVVLTEAARLLAGSANVVPLGLTVLKDFPEPASLHQLVIEGLVNEFPPLQTTKGGRGNLRLMPSPLVGRERELQRCRRMLDEARLVTVTGVGGVGKTRLAHRLAEEAAVEADGAWFIELAAAGDIESVLHTVIAGLGVQVSAGRTPVEAIVDSLRARRLLLVLDNCEQVLDEAADLIEEILARCDQVRVLVTSREGLGLEAEHMFPLRSMPGSDAVRLFIERAAAVGGEFEPDEGTVEQIQELCDRLDGIPLAIELAAARTTAMTVTEIAGRLDERFRFLTGSRRRGVERHQTLRAAVGWSHELLGDTERIIFDRLGVFVSSFDLAAAEAVCVCSSVASVEVFDGLSALVDKSLLIADTSGSVTEYRMLETLRQYAAEQLAEQDALDQVRLAHVDYYTQRFEHIHGLTCGPLEHTVLPMSPGFVANLTAAMTTAQETSPEHAVRIAQCLSFLWALLPLSVVGSWLTAAAQIDTDAEAHLEIEAMLSQTESLSGIHDQAVGRAGRVLADADASSLARVSALFTLMLSDGFYLGDIERGLGYREQVLVAAGDPAQWRSNGVAWFAWPALVMTGLVLGQYDPEVLDAAEQTGSGLIRGYANYAMGFALTNTEPEQAGLLLHRAIEQSELIGGWVNAGMAHRQLGSLEAIHGEPADAVAAIRHTLERFTQTGEWLPQWINLQQFTILLHRTGRLEPAVQLLSAAAASERARKPWPTEQPHYDRLMSDAVNQLGQARVDQLMADGAVLSDIEAVHLARSQLDELDAALS